jgi:ribosome-associated translation inhibitor RaiA
MQLRIASKEPPVTAAIERQIRQRVSELEEHVNNVPGCTRCLRHLRFIAIARAGRVRIHLDMPGSEVTIDKQNPAGLSQAIDEAFSAARVRLEEYVAKHRREANDRGRSPDVRVSTIFHDCYGVLETPDGREVNFHRSPFAALP